MIEVLMKTGLLVGFAAVMLLIMVYDDDRSNKP